MRQDSDTTSFVSYEPGTQSFPSQHDTWCQGKTLSTSSRHHQRLPLAIVQPVKTKWSVPALISEEGLYLPQSIPVGYRYNHNALWADLAQLIWELQQERDRRRKRRSQRSRTPSGMSTRGAIFSAVGMCQFGCFEGWSCFVFLISGHYHELWSQSFEVLLHLLNSVISIKRPTRNEETRPLLCLCW